MAIRKHTTKAARRFQPLDLGHGKTITPIRTEFGAMEYEASFNGDVIGTALSYSDAETQLNEWFYDALAYGHISDDPRDYTPAILVSSFAFAA